MTSFEISRVRFEHTALAQWAEKEPRSTNWPVVYTIDGGRRIYVGESIHALTRMRQHLARPDRSHLRTVRVVADPTFNKSVCLDLEAQLIGWFAGDGKYDVDNANAGLTESNYYNRDLYREHFRAIFEALRADGLFKHAITEIENSDLFKLSPFKTLNDDQRDAVLHMLEQLFQDLRTGQNSTAVIQGQPGTGKTVIGIYLMKVLSDIRRAAPVDGSDSDAVFAGFFTPANATLLADFRMGFVVPQRSLRATISKVFRQTPGLHRDMVLSPAKVGESADSFDLLIVDEAHRLQQLAATMASQITKFRSINSSLFDGDEQGGDQLDWIHLKSKHRIFMLDTEQSIRPSSDLPPHVTEGLQQKASDEGRLYPLKTQMRVRAGEDYIGYIRAILSPNPPSPIKFDEYEFAQFDDLGTMRQAILQREQEVELARLVAGFAWKWRSNTRATRDAIDIEIDGLKLQWNRKPTDWVSSSTSINEVGSIHTIQGYDLNYAGVIIGPDLRYDPKNKRLFFARESYFDVKGKQNNDMLGQTYSDDDLLKYVVNIYRVLLSRGIRGTYVYVCDPALRDYLRTFIPPAAPSVLEAREEPPTLDLMFPPEPGTRGRPALAIEVDADGANLDASASWGRKAEDTGVTSQEDAGARP